MTGGTLPVLGCAVPSVAGAGACVYIRDTAQERSPRPAPLRKPPSGEPRRMLREAA
jgi:hypothetical protein